MLSLADNREVSPVPVSPFEARRIPSNITNTRVTLPFNKACSFKANTSFGKLSLGAGAVSQMKQGPTKNLKTPTALLDPNFGVSLHQLIEVHGRGLQACSSLPR